jgi:hypothetical protein
LHSLNKDRELRVRDQANAVRISASDIIYLVDRLSSLPLLALARLQTTFVETSERMVEAGAWQPIEPRDFLWKRIVEEQQHIEEAICDGNLNVLAGHYFADDRGMRERYAALVHELRDTRTALFHGLLDATQGDVLFFLDKEDAYQTAQLGNRLRATAEVWRQRHVEESSAAVAAMVDELIATVELGDVELIDCLTAPSRPEPKAAPRAQP